MHLYAFASKITRYWTTSLTISVEFLTMLPRATLRILQDGSILNCVDKAPLVEAKTAVNAPL